MEEISFDFILKAINDGTFYTVLSAGVVFWLYKKKDELYDVIMSKIKSKINITSTDLSEHTFFTHLKYNGMNDFFEVPKKDAPKTEFKYYVANVLNFEIQQAYYKNFKDFLKNVAEDKTKLNYYLKEALSDTEKQIEKNIKDIFGIEVWNIYSENTKEITKFYHSLILGMLEYEKFDVNEKIYTILNTLLFTTKTNQNSLFLAILNMNGRLESLQTQILGDAKLLGINNKKQ